MFKTTEILKLKKETVIYVIAVEGTQMLNMKDADRKLEFHLYFHFQEKTQLKFFLTGWKQSFLSLNWNQITSQ